MSIKQKITQSQTIHTRKNLKMLNAKATIQPTTKLYSL